MVTALLFVGVTTEQHCFGWSGYTPSILTVIGQTSGATLLVTICGKGVVVCQPTLWDFTSDEDVDLEFVEFPTTI